MPIPRTPERFEDHVERLIREAIERGDFDELPGEGRPIPGIGAADDELWWIRGWLKRNLGADQPSVDDPEATSSS